MKKLLSLLTLSIISLSLLGQDSVGSAIRGQVLDKQSEFPLPGVAIILLDSDPIKGVTTDIDGYFYLNNVPAGRHSIQISYIGYEPQVKSNLLVTSGRELSVNIFLSESVVAIDVAEIVAEDKKYEALNKMSSVSARSFSVEEAMRYSGSLQDPSRMAQNFAGVSNASDDRNDIIIRGNSPTGVLWRMEGIDIPSPNHFASLGTTGGPVSMLNVNNLANSDFITSAFAPEYGNALAGVFDLKLRNGNINKHEFIGQIGFNGFEIGAEGPLAKGKNASYLANYRYSTLEVFNQLGIEFGTGNSVPQYQDLTFKVDVPTKNAGRFSLFGIGGKSFIEFKGSETTDQDLYSSDAEDSQFGSQTGILGLSHSYFFSDKTKSHLVLAASNASSTGKTDSLSVLDASPTRVFGLDRSQTKLSLNYSINHKFNSKNTMRVGVIGDHYQFSLADSILLQNDEFFYTSDSEGEAQLVQGHINWQHRFNDKVTLNSGLHSQLFLLNNSFVIEPRLGMRYAIDNTKTLSFAAGMHSQMQPLPVYFEELRLENNQSELRNDQLDFNKSIHLVMGYDQLLSEHFRIKTELYYQHLYNIAIDREINSFSILNAGADFVLPNEGNLVNDGIGRNYGFELTAEKFFHNGHYLLATASIFQSEYQGSDEVWRNTTFNGNYVLNLLGGKEFNVGKGSNTLSLDTKITYAGGRWYTPIDLDASIAQGEEVRLDELAFSEQYDPYFRMDFKITFRMNKEKWGQQFAIDFRNLTGRQNIFIESYNNRSQTIETRYQIGFFPDVQYRVYF